MTSPEASAKGSSELRLSLATKGAYGVGAVAEGLKDSAFKIFLLFYYNQVLGVPGKLCGLAVFIALCVDAITDPLMGSISDSFRSRLGRRHPFLYASAVPMGVSIYFLFVPPDGLSDYALFAWLTAFAILVRASMTLFSVPHVALVPEVTTDYNERTSLFTWRLLFLTTAGITISQVAYRFWFRKTGDIDGRLVESSYSEYALVSAIVIVVAILLCAIGTHKLIPRLGQPQSKERFSARRFINDLRDAFGTQSYRIVVLCWLFLSVGNGFNEAMNLYVMTFFWEFSTGDLANISLAALGGIPLGLILTRVISARYGKKRTAFTLACFCIVVGPSPVFLRLLGLMPPNGSSVLVPIMIGHTFIMIASLVIIGILQSSMLADTVDDGELRTGRRQEGVYSSAVTFIAKATTGIGSLLAGITLDLIAFPQEVRDIGLVSDDKILLLGLAVGPGMMILYSGALYFLSRFTITKERYSEIRAELERRHAAQAATESDESPESDDTSEVGAPA